MVLQHGVQILPVDALAEPADDRLELTLVDKCKIESDLLRTADLEPLAHFERAHEARRVDKQIGRARIEPREAPAHGLDIELAGVEIVAVDVGDFVLPARGWFERLCDCDDLRVVKIYRPVTAQFDFGISGFSSIEIARPARSNSITP